MFQLEWHLWDVGFLKTFFFLKKKISYLLKLKTVFLFFAIYILKNTERQRYYNFWNVYFEL